MITSPAGPSHRTPRRRARRLAAVAVAAALVAGACGQKAPESSPSSPSSPPSSVAAVKAALARRQVGAGEADGAARSTDALAVDLYRRLATRDGNLVFSPYSIEIALGMTRNGAKGETRTQMDAVLHADKGDLDQGLNALEAALASRTGAKDVGERSGTIALDTANALWTQQGLPFQPAFLDALARDYDAGVQTVDYRADPEAARQVINDWVEQRTHDKITDLIPAGQIDTLTRFVLTNAVYFKAPWAVKFGAKGNQPFTTGGGAPVSVPTMAGGSGGTYGEGDGWQAARLHYLGNELSMVVVVPEDLASFEATFDDAVLTAILGGLGDPLLSAQLPRFTFRTSVSLKEQLAALGMPLAFTGDADFSGITTAEQLHIGAVLHQAFIAVDEEGTEAAAATAVVGRAGSARPEGKALVVDRPFLFAIVDDATGAVLFLGRVTDPSAH